MLGAGQPGREIRSPVLLGCLSGWANMVSGLSTRPLNLGPDTTGYRPDAAIALVQPSPPPAQPPPPLHSDADGVQNWPDCIARKLMETE